MEVTVDFSGEPYTYCWSPRKKAQWVDDDRMIIPFVLQKRLEKHLSYRNRESSRRKEAVIASGKNPYTIREASDITDIKPRTFRRCSRIETDNGHVDKSYLVKLIELNASCINGWPALSSDFFFSDDFYQKRVENLCSEEKLKAGKDASGMWRIRFDETRKIKSMIGGLQVKESFIDKESGIEYILVTIAGERTGLGYGHVLKWAYLGLVDCKKRDGRDYIPKKDVEEMFCKTYSTSEAAEMLGRARKTLYDWKNKGKIRMLRVPGGRYRVPASEILIMSTELGRVENPPESVFDEHGKEYVLLENIARENGLSHDVAYQMVYSEGVPRMIRFGRTYIPIGLSHEIFPL